ncbi:hypothetical protein PWO45_20360 [Bacillus amyloliquefaciens]|uniref:hypothetical protein n=1 Tax=Bacteria TaxID=2 RepID=UPI000D0BD3AB|nr:MULTISPECIES: hypothetical protein [Bacillus amyloliquefaciens group]MDE5156307.1 hypothetical protein [Bacillus amyloliquefaciens]QRL09366.1 hypothetical protein GKO36_10755 [Bacillus velezensis]
MDSERQSESLNDLLMLQKQVNRLVQKEDALKKNLESTIETFLEKNSRCGSKAGREDYLTHVSCKDIWDLREAYKAYKGE